MRNFLQKMILLVPVMLVIEMVSINHKGAFAQGVPGQGSGLYLSVGMMYLASSTEQGGKGADGSTFLTETEILNKGNWFNYGAFFQFDSQGSSQNNTEIGYKVEFDLSPLYLEVGQSFFIENTFNDRSIASQQGDGYRFGLGFRTPLTVLPAIHIQFSYKQRTQILRSQDGKPLDQKIIQTDTYPVFGLGMTL